MSDQWIDAYLRVWFPYHAEYNGHIIQMGDQLRIRGYLRTVRTCLPPPLLVLEAALQG